MFSLLLRSRNPFDYHVSYDMKKCKWEDYVEVHKISGGTVNLTDEESKIEETSVVVVYSMMRTVLCFVFHVEKPFEALLGLQKQCQSMKFG